MIIRWSSGYGRRLMLSRWCVWIPALYTGSTFFAFICCKIVMLVWKDKNKRKWCKQRMWGREMPENLNGSINVNLDWPFVVSYHNINICVPDNWSLYVIHAVIKCHMTGFEPRVLWNRRRPLCQLSYNHWGGWLDFFYIWLEIFTESIKMCIPFIWWITCNEFNLSFIETEIDCN